MHCMGKYFKTQIMIRDFELIRTYFLKPTTQISLTNRQIYANAFGIRLKWQGRVISRMVGAILSSFGSKH